MASPMNQRRAVETPACYPANYNGMSVYPEVEHPALEYCQEDPKAPSVDMASISFNTPASRPLTDEMQTFFRDVHNTNKIIEALFQKWTYLHTPSLALESLMA